MKRQVIWPILVCFSVLVGCTGSQSEPNDLTVTRLTNTPGAAQTSPTDGARPSDTVLALSLTTTQTFSPSPARGTATSSAVENCGRVLPEDCSGTAAPTRTSTATTTPEPSATSEPDITPTYDASTLATVTELPPNVCPTLDPEAAMPDFSTLWDDNGLTVGHYLDYLNAGGNPNQIPERWSPTYSADLTNDG